MSSNLEREDIEIMVDRLVDEMSGEFTECGEDFLDYSPRKRLTDMGIAVARLAERMRELLEGENDSLALARYDGYIGARTITAMDPESNGAVRANVMFTIPEIAEDLNDWGGENEHEHLGVTNDGEVVELPTEYRRPVEGGE